MSVFLITSLESTLKTVFTWDGKPVTLYPGESTIQVGQVADRSVGGLERAGILSVQLVEPTGIGHVGIGPISIGPVNIRRMGIEPIGIGFGLGIPESIQGGMPDGPPDGTRDGLHAGVEPVETAPIEAAPVEAMPVPKPAPKKAASAGKRKSGATPA